MLRLAFLLVFLSVSYAQDLSDLPTCAQSPALAAIGSTGCQASNFECLCKNSDFIDTALAGAKKQCTADELKKVEAFAQQLCGSVGVSVGPGASTAVPTAAATTMATAANGTMSSMSMPSSTMAAAAGATMSGGDASSGAAGRGASFEMTSAAGALLVVGSFVFGVAI